MPTRPATDPGKTIHAVGHVDGVDDPEDAYHGERDRPPVKVHRAEAEQIAELADVDAGPGRHKQCGNDLGDDLPARPHVVQVVEQADDDEYASAVNRLT